MNSTISVRPFLRDDFSSIVDYFLKADTDFLIGMGVDIPKLPTREKWLSILESNFEAPDQEKQFYYQIWLLDGKPVGHCNINKIVFGDHAFLHLHMWQSQNRKSGLGFEFLKLAIPNFFDRFKLKVLYCEPFAKNEPPNKTLPKLGFTFEKTYDTVPGWINFHQPVNRWKLLKESL